MFDLKSYLSEARRLVDGALLADLGGATPPTRICRAMVYSVMAGGKRLRPILCIAAAESVGGNSHNVMPLACALELIHTYSLIHDDLPAMDDDDRRRGKPTCHVEFDEATAILAGDALLTLAFEIIAAAGMRRRPAAQARWLAALGQVAAAAGCMGMIEGQMRDMMYAGRRISHPELEALHGLKTGRMIEVAVQTGALVSGASTAQERALGDYGRCVGLAFQVVDDILNVKGDPQRMGKAVGSDQAHGKNTYPALIGIEAASELAGRLVEKGLKALDIFNDEAEPLRAIAQYVIERNR
jgi:geranylgeranyl diphosphate synthase type II